MKDMPQISDSEWIVMKILWSNSLYTSSEIIKSLPKNTNWKPTTVKTLISRLVKKDAVGFKKKNRTYYYYPLVTKDECVKAESKSFLKKVYGGALKPMIANFLEIQELSEKDIEELKCILDKKKD
ncbi:BlaI/MecI/CopY family transcriptional regulator [Maledivibacter halophilus]|uniref:BlaI family transcriptional regulator, penicillinase repressor n=1 Tax=Maledivibacter halophilus TaxID=36842 RepID=A0A1T5IT80_9FIRM|nr:BlaI/MecI/CopY family transcriptional regulator [Maledivibacter halophilus]SKC42312.1 BlaI family transcriptional regulator, penicillinase repressor [Maledivibacter halophilus]